MCWRGSQRAGREADMVDTKSYQKRFDVALDTLALTFTDLVVLVETLDRSTEAQGNMVRAQQDRIVYLESRVQRLEQENQQLQTRLGGLEQRLRALEDREGH